MVIPTGSAWPALEPNIETVLRALERVDGELILASSGDDVTVPPCLRERIRLVHRPRADIFALRARGLEAARGTIVGLSEDHCRLPPTWCTEVQKTFDADPRLMVLGGAVINGATATAMDRANFRMTFARFAPEALLAPAPCISNVAVRRAALPPTLEAGWFEYVFLPGWAGDSRLRMRSDLIVAHVQSHGALATPLIHFHNGRLAGAFLARFAVRSRGRSSVRWTLDAMRAHLGSTREGLAAVGVGGTALWLVWLLALAHAAGMAVGERIGPGKSGHYLP